jgi:acetolactate synthase small subunit
MLKELTFVISAENRPDLLARTVMLLHRLHIPVHSLTMQRPVEAPRMRITLEVFADFERSDRIAAQLAKIVHVVSIETLKDGKAVPKQRHALVRKR